MISTSVVIPSYQGAVRLERLFGCLAKQEATFEWEAVVVLDGSTDESREVVRRWEATIPIRLVDLGTNRGRPAALNAGFEAATGRVLIRCDDDLAPEPHYLERHNAHHLDRDDLGVIGYFRNILPDNTYARVYGVHANQLALQAVYSVGPADAWHHWSGNCSVTRDMFDRVGPYDEQFRTYGWEDVDWGYRLWSAGSSIIIDPLLETDHHIAATTTAIRSRRAFLSGSAQVRFLDKHHLAGAATTHLSKGRSPWNAAVTAASSLPTSVRESLARSVDRVGGHLPAPVTRKLIALCVESSGRAGSRHGSAAPAELSTGV